MPTYPSAYETQLRFCRALATVHSLPVDDSLVQPSATDKLSLYALYKQACHGDCNITRPSSRFVVEYAKWKAWDRLRGVSPTEAQKMYVNGIIELLVELTNRYPNHEFAQAWVESLHYLETGEPPKASGNSHLNLNSSENDDQGKSTLDPMGYETEQDRIVMNIDPQQLLQSSSNRTASYPGSPPPLTLASRHLRQTSSEISTPLMTTLSSSGTAQHQEYPTTPEIYPSPYRHIPMKWYPPQSPRLRQDKTHPLERSSEPKDNDDNDTTIVPQPVTTAHGVSEDALEALQTEVTALSEQIDIMRRSFAASERDKRHPSSLLAWMIWLLKTMVKHAIVNSLILVFVVVMLWRRQSPLAYTFLDYIRPSFQATAKRILDKVVRWRVAV